MSLMAYFFSFKARNVYVPIERRRRTIDSHYWTRSHFERRSCRRQEMKRSHPHPTTVPRNHRCLGCACKSSLSLGGLRQVNHLLDARNTLDLSSVRGDYIPPLHDTTLHSGFVQERERFSSWCQSWKVSFRERGIFSTKVATM
jgi:hypothetical protein